MKRLFSLSRFGFACLLCAVAVMANQENLARCLSEDCASGWGRVYTPGNDSNISSLAVFSPSLLIMGNDSGVWRTTFSYAYGSLSWSRLSNIPATCIVTDSLGTTIFFGTSGGGLFRIANGIRANTGLTDMYIKALARDSRGILYVASCSSPISDCTVSCSFDSGATWIGIGKPTPVPPVATTSLAVDSNFTLYAGTTRGVFRYVGGYWDSANTGTQSLPDSQITALAIGMLSQIFVGTNRGAYFSSNAGKSWYSLGGPGLPNHVTALGVGSPGTMMPVVGTDTGLFEYAASTPAVPKGDRISIAFSAGNSLKLITGMQAVVDLRIFDARGEERMQFLHGVIAPGTKDLSLGSLPRGVYFCRISVDAMPIQTRTIVILGP